jgi:uncharacterized membrane protein
MVDLTQFFAAVCGQHLDHTWTPGGIWLPLCQRCTGLYAGAGMAALLHLWLKPKPTFRFLAVHGSFLLLMMPFGFHWLPQGPALRAITGVLFGFGVTAFLWLALNLGSKPAELSLQHTGPNGRSGRWWLYAFVLGATSLAVPLLGTYGGKVSAAALIALCCCGAAGLSLLVLANARRGVLGAIKMVAPLPRAHTS